MRVILSSLTLLASQIAMAATPVDGWYASAFGGYAYVPNNINNSYNNLIRNRASYHAGFDAGGSLGFKSNPMRYEGELTYLNAKLNNFYINNRKQTGNTGYSNGTLAMANVYYDLPNFLNAIQPYLGVGLGYAFVKAELNSTGPQATTRFSGNNSVFAYQAAAGITYNFAENYGLTLGYRYAATEKAHNLGKIFQAQTANIGAVYRFDAANYK